MRLPLFPEPGLDQSVLTPVLIGVLVSWMFTETLGWTFVGLVVPGYLASVFLLHPAAGCIEVVEAILTFALARFVGEGLPRLGIGFRVFGRERFLLVIAASLVVRVAVEGIGLPALFGAAPWAYAMGFVVVPLAANACWKTGLARGLVEHGVPTVIVLVVVRFVLLPHTNLSLGGFELLTQDLAGSFLAAPKAYLVLLVSALLASTLNVRYGWDFGGVLVPSLLALAWFSPVRVAATFVEAGAIALLGTMVERFVGLEGPRRLVAYLAVEYGLRFALGHAFGHSLPGTALRDMAGIGYILPTLLALKLASKGALVVLPTALTATAGFVLGNAVSYAFELADPAPDAPSRVPANVAPPAPPPLPKPRDTFLTSAPLAPSPSQRTMPALARLAFATATDALFDTPALPMPPAIEERAILRRRIFAPLLDESAPDVSLLARAAEASGYRAKIARDGVALFAEGKPLAAIARTRRGARRPIVVATLQAQDRGLRDTTHRIAAFVDADLTLLVAAEGGFDESLRTVLDLVRGGDAVDFVMVRGARPELPLSSYGIFGDGAPLVGRMRDGFHRFGLELRDDGSDRVARRISGGFDRDDVVVNVHVDPVAQAALSLGPLRRVLAVLGPGADVDVRDRIESPTGALRVDPRLVGLLHMIACDESTTAARALRGLDASGTKLVVSDEDGRVALAIASTSGGLLHVERGGTCDPVASR